MFACIAVRSTTDRPVWMERFSLFPTRRAAYTYDMDARRFLVVASILATTATLVAVLEGAWLIGAVFYVTSVVVLGFCLRRVIRQRRVQTHQHPRSTAHP